MATGSGRAIQCYVAVVIVAGLATLGSVLAFGEWAPLGARPELIIFLGLVVLVGELFPVTVSYRNEREDVTTSTTFVFAVLLMFGPVATILTQCGASLASDLRMRKSWWKAAFNVAQYALSWTACSFVLDALAGQHPFLSARDFNSSRLLGVMVAAFTFFVANMALINVAVALAQHLPVLPHIRRNIGFFGFASIILFSLSPIVVIVAGEQTMLVPLVLAPVLAIYRSTQIASEKEHQALHDHLTGLPNRSLFRERTVQMLSERPGSPLAVLIIDLDHFKEVNDTLGHQMGDLLLPRIGHRFTEVLHDSEMVARLGGDEFAVLTSITDAAAVAAVCTRIIRSLEEPFVIDELTFQIEASIGAAVYPEHGDDVDTLIQRADIAMYLAKETRSGYEVYDAARDRHDTRRLALLGELRQAIENDQMVLHFQPKADLASGKLMGAEALVRWQHPEYGLLPPDEFIPLAEPTGLITPLTMFVLDKALSYQHDWRLRGYELSVAVNVSVRSLYDNHFVHDVQRLLQKWRTPPNTLVLEITESMMMVDPSRAAGILSKLSVAGVQISVDDFGTGYSSLSYLKRLPVSEIKIDKSFVLNMAEDPDDASIVDSIIDLGKNLGLRVVAEGVESEAAWHALAERGATAPRATS